MRKWWKWKQEKEDISPRHGDWKNAPAFPLDETLTQTSLKEQLHDRPNEFEAGFPKK